MQRAATSKKAGSIRMTATAGSGVGAISGKAEVNTQPVFRFTHLRLTQSEIIV